MGNRLQSVIHKREKAEHAPMKMSIRNCVKGVEKVNKLPAGILYLFVFIVIDKAGSLQQLRGTPTTLARIHELFNDGQHAVVMVEGSKREWYVPILTIVDKNVPTAVVGVLNDTINPNALSYKVEKAPVETFDDIGGYEMQIQEIKESVELPLTHPEYYEEMGIAAPKGVILYGEPGTGVLELFKMAKENAPCILFLDEIDAVGTKRFNTSSRGEQEVQRTLLELLNQLDGFENRGDIKVIMATNRINSLDSALIRPGRIDRKIELPKPDEKTKYKIFQIHTSGMNIGKDVTPEVLGKEKDISGAEIKAICTEAGMLALRHQRKFVCADDFKKAIENVLLRKNINAVDQFYL
uniref:AAA domain-containing protein n=1 Tax=Heterorhabditis bacteriophora TaxID=37862 RepID=A0A1I7X732_HETBA